MYNLLEKITNKGIKVTGELFITKTNTIHNNVDELHKLDIFFEGDRYFEKCKHVV